MNRKRWRRQHAEQCHVERAVAARAGEHYIDVPSSLLKIVTRVFTCHATVNDILAHAFPRGPRLRVDRPLRTGRKPRTRSGAQIIRGVMSLLRPDDQFVIPGSRDHSAVCDRCGEVDTLYDVEPQVAWPDQWLCAECMKKADAEYAATVLDEEAPS